MSGMAGSAAALLSTSSAMCIGPVARVTRSTSRRTPSSRTMTSAGASSLTGWLVARSTTLTNATRSRACASRSTGHSREVAAPTARRSPDDDGPSQKAGEAASIAPRRPPRRAAPPRPLKRPAGRTLGRWRSRPTRGRCGRSASSAPSAWPSCSPSSWASPAVTGWTACSARKPWLSLLGFGAGTGGGHPQRGPDHAHRQRARPAVRGRPGRDAGIGRRRDPVRPAAAMSGSADPTSSEALLARLRRDTVWAGLVAGRRSVRRCGPASRRARPACWAVWRWWPVLCRAARRRRRRAGRPGRGRPTRREGRNPRRFRRLPAAPAAS